MKRTVFLLSLLLSLTMLAGCGTSDTGQAQGVGAVGTVNAEPVPAPAVHEADQNSNPSTDPEYFYRDSEGAGFVAQHAVIDYGERSYHVGRSFRDQYQALVDAGSMPDTGYAECDISGWYMADGSFWGLTFLWQDGEPDEYRQMTLNLWPRQPGEDDRDDNYYHMDTAKMTVTPMRTSAGETVEVYGDLRQGTDVHMLLWSMPDGAYCQLEAHGRVPAVQDMPPVLDFVLDRGVDWDAFAMDKSDNWPPSEQEEILAAFPSTYQSLKDRTDLVMEVQGQLVNGQLWEDFWNAVTYQTPARVVAARLTTEGDPILYLIDCDGERFQWYMDASRDAFGVSRELQTGDAKYLLRLADGDYLWYILSDEMFADYDEYWSWCLAHEGEEINWPVNVLAVRTVE